MKITSLQIHTNQLDATRKFYHENLQLTISGESENHITFQLQQGSITFQLEKTIQPIYHIAYNIPCNQIKEALEWLQQKAEIIPVDEKNAIADFSNWNAEAIYFYDHQKNIIEFIARRDLHNESAKKFTSASILSISEVGIVTDDVQSTIKEIRERFEIDLFTKQPPHEKFAAMGDDEGLFIIVSNHRPWYPTQVISSMQWLKVDFIQKDQPFSFEIFPENF